MARQIGDPNGEATALFNTAVEEANRGKLTRAIDYGNQALTILEEIEAGDIQKVRDKLAQWREMLQSSPTAGPPHAPKI